MVRLRALVMAALMGRPLASQMLRQSVRSPTPSWKKPFSKIPGCGAPPIVNLCGIYAACGMPHLRFDPTAVMKIVSVSLPISAN